MKKIYDEKSRLFVRKLALIIYDMVAVYVAAIISLMVRFQFSYTGQVKTYGDRFLNYHIIIIIATIIIFAFWHMYSSLWSFAGATEMFNIACACVCAGIAQIIIVTYLPPDDSGMPRTYYAIYAVVLFILEFSCRFFYRAFRSVIARRADAKAKSNIMVIGAGAAGAALIREITHSSHVNKRVVCAIDDDKNKRGIYINGIKIVGNCYIIGTTKKNPVFSSVCPIG